MLETTTMRRAVLGLVVAGFFGRTAVAGAVELQELRAEAKRDPGGYAAQLALGKGLRRAGEARSALEVLRRAERLGRDERTRAAARLEIVRLRIDAHDFKGAVAACAPFASYPGEGKARWNACRAEAYLLQNRATEAMPDVDTALGLDPTLYEARVAQARALTLKGQGADAEAAFRKSIETDPARPEAYHVYGLWLRNQDRKDDGIQRLRLAVDRDPGNPWILVDLAATLGTTPEARTLLERATQIRPGYVEAHAELARVALALGESEAAERAAQKALKLDPKSLPAVVALARIRVAQQKWSEALRLAETAAKLSPNSAVVEIVTGDVQAGRGETDVALTSYEKAFGLDRSSPEALFRGARAALTAKRTTTAKAFALKATGEFPQNREAWALYGETLAADGEPGEARKAYERALATAGALPSDLELRGRLDALPRRAGK